MMSGRRISLSTVAAMLAFSSCVALSEDVIRDIRIEPVTPPAPSELLRELGGIAGQPATQENADRLTEVVLEHFKKHDFPVVDVETTLAEGVAVARATTGRVGNIDVQGGPSSARTAVAGQWKSLPGRELRMSELTSRLDWLHRNPMQVATLKMHPGSTPGTADLIVDLQSTRMAKFAAGYQNDGIEPLSEHRFFAGVEGSDWLGLPWWFSAQFFAGDDASAYQSGRAVGRFFLPWRHELRLSGAWTRAKIDGDLIAPLDASTAESWQLSGRYLIPLPPWKRWKTDAGIGMDFRRTNNTVEFGGSSLGGNADVLQFAAEISSERHGDRSDSGWRLEGIYSPGNLTKDQTDKVHNDFRPGAEADYWIGRGQIWHRQRFGEWNISGQINGQVSSDPVLPSEQIALGGAYAVRGFPEASALGDSGVWGGLEIQSPRLELLGAALQPVAFVEGGWIRDESLHEADEIAGAGCGLKMRIADHAFCSVDYAWRLTEPGGRFHLAFRVEF